MYSLLFSLLVLGLGRIVQDASCGVVCRRVGVNTMHGLSDSVAGSVTGQVGA